jgi:hypothetical protein
LRQQVITAENIVPCGSAGGIAEFVITPDRIDSNVGIIDWLHNRTSCEKLYFESTLINATVDQITGE